MKKKKRRASLAHPTTSHECLRVPRSSLLCRVRMEQVIETPTCLFGTSHEGVWIVNRRGGKGASVSSVAKKRKKRREQFATARADDDDDFLFFTDDILPSLDKRIPPKQLRSLHGKTKKGEITSVAAWTRLEFHASSAKRGRHRHRNKKTSSVVKFFSLLPPPMPSPSSFSLGV